jgi:hypothetical protein
MWVSIGGTRDFELRIDTLVVHIAWTAIPCSEHHHERYGR